ncbi:MAG: efflux RND transporter periplasmic adaptor subunit [Labilithrix sp.]|nr:efflux RND transporter periplasmic adaptor subunit [Labilithrix sp.]
MVKPRALLAVSSLGAVVVAAIAIGLGCRAAAPDAAAAERKASTAEQGGRGAREGRGDTAAQPPVPVRLASVAAGPVDRPIHGTGVVRLKSEADLSFKVGGVVTAVLVEEGARIRKGQVLARLDPTEVDAALRQAEEAAAKADRDLDRVRKLHASGALPVADLQNAETGASLSRAAVDAAAFNARRAVIVAPDDGRVDRRMLEPGEVVAPGRPAFHVSGRSKGAVVRIALVDRDVLRVREGDEARVVLDARPEVPLSGKVTQIATVATPGVGTFDVEVKLEAPAVSPPTDEGAPPARAHAARAAASNALMEGLLSGLTAKVEIHRPEQVAGIVPIGAIASGHGADASVFVIDAGRAKRVPVTVAFLLDGKAALAAAPFEPRAMVVEAGAAQLEDGSPVRVLAETAKP